MRLCASLRCTLRIGLILGGIPILAVCGACRTNHNTSAIQSVEPVRLEAFEPGRVESVQPQAITPGSPADNLVQAERARMASEDQKRAANALEKIEPAPEYRDEPILSQPHR